jgi:pimeloyl-ACP methyl ester carboxylesterase
MEGMHRINKWRYDERGAGNLEEIERIQRDHGEDIPEPSDRESAKVHEMLKSYSSKSVDYSSITVPALHLYGEYELEMISHHVKHMASAIPRSEARQIPNAGHSSHVDNPKFIVESLLDFLASSVGHGLEQESRQDGL